MSNAQKKKKTPKGKDNVEELATLVAEPKLHTVASISCDLPFKYGWNFLDCTIPY